MKKVKNGEDNKKELIFDYENFLSKSSQQRYYELKMEVKNKLENINAEISIAGSNEKEKKYNLLMYYKYMLDDCDNSRKESRFIMDTLLSFIKDAVLILTVVYTVLIGSRGTEPQDLLKNYLLAFIVAFIIIGGVAYLYKEQVRNEKEKAKKYSQKYLYYKFYYNELKMYIKEKD